MVENNEEENIKSTWDESKPGFGWDGDPYSLENDKVPSMIPGQPKTVNQALQD